MTPPRNVKSKKSQGKVRRRRNPIKVTDAKGQSWLLLPNGDYVRLPKRGKKENRR